MLCLTVEQSGVLSIIAADGGVPHCRRGKPHPLLYDGIKSDVTSLRSER